MISLIYINIFRHLTTLYKAQVGDLSKLIHASGKDNSTIVDELNDINDRLEWKELK